MSKINCLLVGVGLLSATTSFGQIVVNQFEPYPAATTVDKWYLTDVRTGGSATIESLVGKGGNLETAQPLPLGAAHLVTDGTTAAKAEVGTFADFGLASQVLSSIDLGYSYYKTKTTEEFAAPSIKLTLWNPTGVGDSFGTLVYEPNWNQTGINGSAKVPTDAWQTVTIDETTGAGGDAAGGWWWNGGFGQANGAGGPPVKSLAEWNALFQANSDYAGAHVITLSMGVGTYNVNQDDYFDNVSIKTGAINKTYDFMGRPVPDAASTSMLLGISLAGLAAIRRKL